MTLAACVAEEGAVAIVNLTTVRLLDLHQYGAIMSFCECFHEEVPDARNIQKMPLRTRRSLTLGTPRGLFGRKGLMAVHSKSVSSYLMFDASGSGA
jgi:hypothetical protein